MLVEVKKASLAVEMHEKGRTIDLDLFLIVTSCLHVMNLMMCSPCENYFGSGSMSSRNAIQFLCACCALQKEFEAEEWQKNWDKENDEPFGERFSALVRTRWEHIGLSSVKFHDKSIGFEKVAKGVANSEKVASQKCKIASDLTSLILESVLIPQNLFLRAYHLNF